MRIGIDFGTTRIVVASADRGNYPLVNFDGPEGAIRDWIPPLVAVHEQQRVYGWDTWAVQGKPGWTFARSLKRWLKSAGPDTVVRIGDQDLPLQQLLIEMASALRLQLRKHSSLRIEAGEPLEAMLGVPANANGNQRFLTVEAFRQAGFTVLGLLNEPSAASIEFGHRSRHESKEQSKRRLLVYDLGGGTFDTSIVEVDRNIHLVLASGGVSTLGGDDFDEILAEMALESAGVSPEQSGQLSQAEWFHLREECREKKESLNPNSRKIVIDLEPIRQEWGEVSIPVSAFYERCRPLVEKTLHVVEELVADNPGETIETLYVTGGGAELPLVARVLRDSFGRRVRRSAYMRSATAIGLAIQADAHSGYVLRDRFTHNFGVWREADDGANVVFDVLFPRGSALPGRGEPLLRTVRAYSPAHNIGHFRYSECAQVTADGRPVGDIMTWDDILFPFDPVLRENPDWTLLLVSRGPGVARDRVEEVYTCDSNGMVTVKICNVTAGYAQQYRLGRWSAKHTGAVPVRQRRECRTQARPAGKA